MLLFFAGEEEVDDEDDQQEGCADKSEAEITAGEQGVVAERVVQETREVIDSRENGEAGEERKEMVRFLFRLITSGFDLLAYHTIQLIVITLGIETFLHGRTDDIRQEIIGDSGITIPLFKLIESFLQNSHILFAATIMEVDGIKEDLAEKLVDIDLLEVISLPVFNHSVGCIGREERESIQQGETGPSGKDRDRMFGQYMLYVRRAVDAGRKGCMSCERTCIVQQELFVTFLNTFRHLYDLEEFELIAAFDEIGDLKFMI